MGRRVSARRNFPRPLTWLRDSEGGAYARASSAGGGSRAAHPGGSSDRVWASAARAVLRRSASGRVRRGSSTFGRGWSAIFGLALAVSAALARMADDDLEHCRRARSPGAGRPPARRPWSRWIAAGEGSSLAVGQLQHQPVNRRADGRQVTELATPDIRRDAADSGDGFEDEAADRSGRSNAGRAGTDQVAQPVLNLLLAIGDRPVPWSGSSCRPFARRPRPRAPHR